MAKEERESEADGRLPAGVHYGSDPNRKKGRREAPPPTPDPIEHDPIQASYETLDALLRFLISRARGDDGYDLQQIREALHGGPV